MSNIKKCLITDEAIQDFIAYEDSFGYNQPTDMISPVGSTTAKIYSIDKNDKQYFWSQDKESNNKYTSEEIAYWALQFIVNNVTND